MLTLSQDQNKALSKLTAWFSSNAKSPYITLGGFAGTGKTTLISIFRNELNEKNKNIKVAFCAYTGKAARVLRTKIVESKSLFPQDTIGTIHSLIYAPVKNGRDEIISWERKEELKADLIIVDEASMVDNMIWNDLLSYKIPIIAVGDHGQLPPIRGNFNLMEKPLIKLEEIHRQAKDNPIINLSIQAREKGVIKTGDYGYNVMKIDRGSSESQEIVGELLQNFKEDMLVLCGYNNTRIKLNKYVRSSLSFEFDTPQIRDRVICLKNNHQKQIFNGMIGTIKSIASESDDVYSAEIQMDGEDDMYRGFISKDKFYASDSNNFGEKRDYSIDQFDFGYALTVHKAQGSQAPRVILFEERFKQMDDQSWRRWLYTAVTRAESELFIVG